MMVALGIDAVIVLEDDRIHGIVTTSDLAASLVEHGVRSQRQRD
jgi:CBS domain-containing protein